jgi:4-hydroxy-4-methyl-2-oxoglutarate aldolase
MNDDVAARLERLDVGAVSDALDLLGLPPSITGLLALTVRKRIAGRVRTVRLAPGRTPSGASAQHLCTAAIDSASAGEVIVVEQHTGIECAGWGGILSSAARAHDLSGVIVEGLARDIDEAADIGFPVYARGATARTARGRIHEAETGGVIRVGDVTVRQGDYVLADSSGTAFIPAENAEAVIASAESIAAKEARMSQAALAGGRVSAIMDGTYEHLLDRRQE